MFLDLIVHEFSNSSLHLQVLFPIELHNLEVEFTQTLIYNSKIELVGYLIWIHYLKSCYLCIFKFKFSVIDLIFD